MPLKLASNERRRSPRYHVEFTIEGATLVMFRPFYHKTEADDFADLIRNQFNGDVDVRTISI